MGWGRMEVGLGSAISSYIKMCWVEVGLGIFYSLNKIFV